MLPPEVLALARAFTNWVTLLTVTVAELAHGIKARNTKKDTEMRIPFLKDLWPKSAPPLFTSSAYVGRYLGYTLVQDGNLGGEH